MPDQQTHYLLECPVQYYDWGNRDDSGMIRTLFRLDPDMEPGKPHAELWMGAHPRSPSLVLPDRIPLNRLVDENPHHILGPDLCGDGIMTFPYLFKILDSARPLSIQSHPDKKLAEQLHSLDPVNYPDNNHKPELAICLKDMKALLGFRTRKEILFIMDRFPELKEICYPDDSGDDTQFIKGAYERLLTADPQRLRKTVLAHLDRAQVSRLKEDKIFLDLVGDYGYEDPGVLCVYFLNYLELEPYDAIFLGPNEPHAYLNGQILECMASSDNVVRAGLTSKRIDVQTLLQMLNYRSGVPAIIHPRKWSDRIYHYPVPVTDFRVFEITPQEEPAKLFEVRSPTILLVFEDSIRIEIVKSDGIVSSERYEQGSVLLFPGDLHSRGFCVRVAAGSAKTSRSFLATAGINLKENETCGVTPVQGRLPGPA